MSAYLIAGAGPQGPWSVTGGGVVTITGMLDPLPGNSNTGRTTGIYLDSLNGNNTALCITDR